MNKTFNIWICPKCQCITSDEGNCGCNSGNTEPKPKQIGDRYRARKDPDHPGLWVIVDRHELQRLWHDNETEILAEYTWGYGVVYAPESNNYIRFPTIEQAIDFIQLLEVSDQVNRSIV